MRGVARAIAASLIAFVGLVGLAEDAKGDGPGGAARDCVPRCAALIGMHPEACGESPACRPSCSKDGSEAACESCVAKCLEPQKKAIEACLKKCG